MCLFGNLKLTAKHPIKTMGTKQEMPKFKDWLVCVKLYEESSDAFLSSRILRHDFLKAFSHLDQ